jgi:hypothetical protein
LGYTWAVLAIAVVLATFMANDYLSGKFASATGIAVSPWFSGGEVLQIREHDRYRTVVHRPVFDALIGERSEGFVQVNWEPADQLPSVIEENIEVGHDKLEHFAIRLDTKTGAALLFSRTASVVGLERAYRLKNSWAVRVLLSRTTN